LVLESANKGREMTERIGRVGGWGTISINIAISSMALDGARRPIIAFRISGGACHQVGGKNWEGRRRNGGRLAKSFNEKLVKKKNDLMSSEAGGGKKKRECKKISQRLLRRGKKKMKLNRKRNIRKEESK